MTQNLTIGRPLVILTGGIATGKSTIAQRLRQHGIDVIDTDAIAHALTAPHGAALPELRKAFGNAIFAADGTLDRAALRDIVFHDPDQKTQLEQILHPMIRRQAIEAIAAATSPYVVADVPLFAETGFLREQADRVLVVDCPPDIQKQRLLARGNLPKELADLILQAQAPRDTRLSLATDVLDNRGSPEQRDEQLDQIHQRYLTLANSAENNDKNPIRV
ncbi:MAG: dephospho-CoA kinase [Pseudomonadota bacterium]|jgi:dephospho-CoA kinase